MILPMNTSMGDYCTVLLRTGYWKCIQWSPYFKNHWYYENI